MGKKKKLNADKWTVIKKFELIEQVRNRPVIWDNRMEGYSKKAVTEAEWEKLAESLSCCALEAKKVWRSLRVYFTSLRRSCLHENSGQILDQRFNPNWQFYSSMKFLIPTIHPREILSNFTTNASVTYGMDGIAGSDDNHPISNESEELDEKAEEINGDVNFDTSDDSKSSSAQPAPRLHRRTSSDKGRRGEVEQVLPILLGVAKRMRENEESRQMVELMSTVSQALKNKPSLSTDDHFVGQLLCHLKEIPDGAEKEKFKLQIMKQLIEFKYSQY